MYAHGHALASPLLQINPIESDRARLLKEAFQLLWALAMHAPLPLRDMAQGAGMFNTMVSYESSFFCSFGTREKGRGRWGSLSFMTGLRSIARVGQCLAPKGIRLNVFCCRIEIAYHGIAKRVNSYVVRARVSLSR